MRDRSCVQVQPSRMLLATLLIIFQGSLIGCTLRRHVVLVSYPICNLKCPTGSTETKCEVSASDFTDAQLTVKRKTGYGNTQTLHVSAGEVLVLSTFRGHHILESQWTSFACLAPLGRIPVGQGQEYALCKSYAGDWLKEFRESRTKVLFDPNYQAACLNTVSVR